MKFKVDEKDKDKEQSNSYARIIVSIENRDEPIKWKVILGTGVVGGVFTTKQLLERKDKFHLDNKSRHKNFILKEEDGEIWIKDMPINKYECFLCMRGNTIRSLPVVKNEVDNIIGIYETYYYSDEWNSMNILFWYDLITIYGLPMEAYDIMMENFMLRYKVMVRNLCDFPRGIEPEII